MCLVPKCKLTNSLTFNQDRIKIRKCLQALKVSWGYRPLGVSRKRRGICVFLLKSHFDTKLSSTTCWDCCVEEKRLVCRQQLYLGDPEQATSPVGLSLIVKWNVTWTSEPGWRSSSLKSFPAWTRMNIYSSVQMACLWRKLSDKARMSWGKDSFHTAFRIKINVDNVTGCSTAKQKTTK